MNRYKAWEKLQVKVCVVSPRSAARKNEILQFLAIQTAELVVLPGWAPNMPSAKSVQRALRNGVSAFVETAGGKFGGRPSLVTRRSTSVMPRQVFARQPSAGNMDELADAPMRRAIGHIAWCAENI